MKRTDLLLIGGGASGLCAAVAAKRARPGASVLLLEQLGYIKLKQEYELFKLQWMIDHGYTLRSLMDELDRYSAEEMSEFLDGNVIDLDLNPSNIFSEWESERGFNGNIYPCFEEWLENDRECERE